MADPETLAALKRAYADTILNTTKEAAARVIVSEKKARRYQQELMTVRDEALHTLLRLKYILDAKVKESETISLKQQQKVEELEAQLGEAEDIAGELRMELRQLQDELQKLMNGQTHLKSDHEEDLNCDAAVSVVPEVSCVEQSGLVVANGIKPQLLGCVNSINRCSSKDIKDQCHYTLPSILTKRRAAEGFTKMVHAVDSSMTDKDLSSSVEVGDVDGVYLHKDPSCKNAETIKMSGCADATYSISRDGEDPMVSQNSPKKDVGTPMSLKTSPREHENDKMLEISENMDVSASPLCKVTPVLTLSKNRCIKYTFKRKRKKEVLRNLEADSSIEKRRDMKQKD